MKTYAKTLAKLPVDTVHSNISAGERLAINSLNNNKSIVIRSVDKGGGIVVMNTDYYVQKVEECLSANQTYKKLNNFNLTSQMKKMEKFSDKTFKHVLTDEERLYLHKFDFKLSNFYGSPKIHKSKKISEALESSNNIYIKISGEVDLPFRFITTSINSPTSKLSELLGILLKPFVNIAPSYIRDSTDFLNKKPIIIDNSVDLRAIIFVTCDVSNMYANITLKLGLEAIEYWLDTNPHLLHGRFTKEFILEGITLVMSSSCFQFNDECYSLQVGTVVMFMNSGSSNICQSSYGFFRNKIIFFGLTTFWKRNTKLCDKKLASFSRRWNYTMEKILWGNYPFHRHFK